MKIKTPTNPRIEKGIKIVFIDLDLTLFDYTASREKGAIKALKKLSNKPNNACFLTYQKVIENWRAFEILGFVDIKRYWNHLSIYYLVYVFTSTNFRKHTNSFFKTLKRLQTNSENEKKVLKIKTQNKNIINLFNTYYLSIKRNKEVVKKAELARSSFEIATARLRPFNGAKSLLTKLKKSGYYFIISTEGDQEIQSEKLSKLDLLTLVGSSKLLVTNDLSKPYYISKKIENKKKSLLKLLSLSPNQKDWFSLQLSSLFFIQEKLKLFDLKRDRHFYGHAIHIAVSQALGKYNEKDFSNISPNQWRKLPPIKIATLGDRYSNDIRPLLEIISDKSLLSLQLLYGKYKHEKLRTLDKKPDFYIKELSQAKNIITRDEYWTQKNPITRPKHFYLPADELLIWHSAIGLTLSKPISSIAESILHDIGFPQKKIVSLKNKISLTANSILEKKELVESLRKAILDITGIMEI